LKKIAAAFLFALLLAGSTGLDAAAESAVIADESVRLGAGAKTGSFQITVNSNTPFAGCEFAAVCGDGIKITAVSYSAGGAMTTGPTDARGASHFSFYAANNQFSGAVTATVSFECEGDKNTSVLLYTAKTYTRSGADVTTQAQTINRVIEIRIEGKTNPIDPPDPPEPDPDSSASPASSDGAGASSRGGSNAGGSSAGSSENAGAGSSPDGSGPQGTDSGSPEETPANNPEDTASGSRGAVIFLSVALGVSLLGNGALGVLLYRSKKGGNGIGRLL
jgi:hypothetical protein